MKPNDVAIRKRTQIAKANRTMFIWIAIASVIVGSAAVVSYFLFQKLVFNEKVIGEKLTTVSILKHNNDVVPQLEEAIRVLDTNSALTSIKSNESDQAVQVILDALPSQPSSLALGASLQNKILAGISGLNIETLQVDPIIGVETEVIADAAPADDSLGNIVTFTLKVSGDQNAIKQVLVNLERSIRTFDVQSVHVETQEGGKQLMTVQAHAYYEPKKNIELKDKKVSP